MARDERRILLDAVRQEALVTLLDDTGVRGILWQADADGYLLRRSASTPIEYYGHDSTEPQQVDQGELFVPAGQVRFIQLFGKG